MLTTQDTKRKAATKKQLELAALQRKSAISIQPSIESADNVVIQEKMSALVSESDGLRIEVADLQATVESLRAALLKSKLGAKEA